MPPVIIVQAESTTLVAIAVVALTLFVLKRIRARLATAASVAQFEPKVERKRRDVEERLNAAKAAGLTWEGCLAWAASNPKATSKLAPVAVIKMTATELLAAMNKDKKLSSEYVMRCFIGRAMATHARLNAVTEQDYINAVAEAKKCDAERNDNNKVLRGPLHGLPISIKEQVRMKGFDSTCGAKSRLYKPSEKDAVLVSALRKAGAVPFCRTNVPQLLLVPESTNTIYGDTNNPFDVTRTPGGSSGGESALVSALGSPLGVGTDVGGSIRIPAHFTGLCGLKPTVDRLSYKGTAIPRKGDRNGQKEIKSCMGPLARTVDDLALFMAACCSSEERGGEGDGPASMYVGDPSIPKLPWDHQAYADAASTALSIKGGGLSSGGRSSRSSSAASASGRKLRIGYYTYDGWFEPAPACARAVDETVAALKACGHELIPFEPLEMPEAVVSYVSLMAADGGMIGFVESLEGEPMHTTYGFLYNVANLPNRIRPLLGWVLQNVLKQPRKAKLVAAGNGKSAKQYYDAINQRDALRDSFMSRFQAARLDALLCPALGVPAFPHGQSVYLNMACSYTFVWNAFNLPAGTIPVTTVAEGEAHYDKISQHKDSFVTAAQKAMKGAEGLPVGVQFVCMPWQEELCLGVMKVAEAALEESGAKRPMPPEE